MSQKLLAGFEPATSSLPRMRSTPELQKRGLYHRPEGRKSERIIHNFPHPVNDYFSLFAFFLIFFAFLAQFYAFFTFFPFKQLES